VLGIPTTDCGGAPIWHSCGTEVREKSRQGQGHGKAGRGKRFRSRSLARASKRLLVVRGAGSDSKRSGGSFLRALGFMVAERFEFSREQRSL